VIRRGLSWGEYIKGGELSQSTAGAILRTCPAVGRAGEVVRGVGGGWQSE